MITELHLHGRLGHIFGREWNFDVARSSDAVRALCTMRPDFRAYMVKQGKQAGVVYRVKIDGRDISTLGEIHLPLKKRVDIFPIPAGSKSAGVFEAVLGVVLIAAAAVVFVATDGMGFGAYMSILQASEFELGGGAGIFSMIAALGLAMAIGGIAQLIANPKTRQSISASSTFGGPGSAGQTTQQGGAVPIGYGTLFVGPFVVNAGLDSFNINPGNGQIEDDTNDGIVVTTPGNVTPVDSYSPPA